MRGDDGRTGLGVETRGRMAVVKASVDLATLSHDAIALALQHYGRTLRPLSHTPRTTRGAIATPTPPGEEPAAAVVKLHNGYRGCNYRVQTTPVRHGQPGWEDQHQQEEVSWTQFRPGHGQPEIALQILASYCRAVAGGGGAAA